MLGSLLFNLPRLYEQKYYLLLGSYWVRGELTVEALKKSLFLLSFVLTFYFIVSVFRSEDMILRITRIIVAGVSIVAFFGIVEARTGYNLFDHLRTALRS